MIVVSDTTPIISLLKINRLDLVEKSFGEVLIPNAVYEELTANQRFIEEARRCIDDLQRSGRHIGERHYQMLLDRLQ